MDSPATYSKPCRYDSKIKTEKHLAGNQNENRKKVFNNKINFQNPLFWSLFVLDFYRIYILSFSTQ